MSAFLASLLPSVTLSGILTAYLDVSGTTTWIVFALVAAGLFLLLYFGPRLLHGARKA